MVFIGNNWVMLDIYLLVDVGVLGLGLRVGQHL